MENFENMKSHIVDCMTEYYCEKYRENIKKCLDNIKKFSFEKPLEENEQVNNNNTIYTYFYSSTDEIKKILNNEEYDSIVYPDCCYYCRMVEKYNVSEPLIKEFIAISERVCDTPKKQLYAFVESCIKIFMSQDNCLDQKHVNHRIRYDNGYYLNRGVIKDFENDQYEEPVLFENACTKYDAMKITQNILVTNENDFVYDSDIYFDYICILLNNERTREEINYSRINHILLKDTKDKPLKTIQSIIDNSINKVFFDEKAKNEVIKDYLNIVNEINIKFPSEDEKRKN